MELKMYAFGEDTGVTYWICANNEEEAIQIYKEYFGETAFIELVEDYCGDSPIREMSKDEDFRYYPDGCESDEDSIGNLINRYCSEPKLFACSEF
jgi:hypothetical protein